MRLLYGEFDLGIDDKGRLLIPAEIRKRIDPETDGEAFLMVVGINAKPWLYPEKYYESLALAGPAEMTPEEDVLAFDQMNFGMASRLELDKQGRVLIPEKTMRRTEISREVTVVGVRNHLELWNRADWQARRDELIARSAEIAVRAKQVRKTVESHGEFRGGHRPE